MTGLCYNFGKLLLVVALIGQGYLTLTTPQIRADWNNNVQKLAKNYESLQFWGLLIPFSERIVLALAGIQLTAFFLLFSNRLSLVALLNVLALVLFTIVMGNPSLYKTYENQLETSHAMLKYLATIGGLLWYIAYPGEEKLARGKVKTE